MKVAMIGHKVVPSRRGGIENVLTTLCPLLSDLEADITCYNRSSDKAEAEYAETVKDAIIAAAPLALIVGAFFKRTPRYVPFSTVPIYSFSTLSEERL